MLTNDLEATATSGACQIGSYIIIYADIVTAREQFKYYNWSPRSLRFDKLKFCFFSRSF